jgi:hypothetical protein
MTTLAKHEIDKTIDHAVRCTMEDDPDCRFSKELLTEALRDLLEFGIIDIVVEKPELWDWE